MSKRVLFLLMTLLFAAAQLLAQPGSNYSALRDSISVMSRQIWKQTDDSAKLKAGSRFQLVFSQMLADPANAGFPFDSVPGITRAAGADGKLQLYTWNIPYADGTFAYQGLIRLLNKNIAVIPLNARKSGAAIPENRVLGAAEWYGALYYKLIENKLPGKMLYTILGWDGSNSLSDRKIIDVFTIEGDSAVFFGSPVFRQHNALNSRVVYEYAEQASFLLRYDKQAYRIYKGGKLKKTAGWLIIADQLVPMSAGLKGNRRYYVPSGEAYEGYYFKNGVWNFTDRVDVRNPASKATR